MIGFTAAVVAAAAAFVAPSSTALELEHARNGQSSGQMCSMLTAEEIRSMGNNSLFTRWRPRSHFIAPAGWMNDPCGPMYDPSRDLYTHFYQWHPEHINWGNISWGYATSKDLVTWTDHISWQNTSALALGPTGFGNYDGLGIFSGTMRPVNLQGQEDGSWLIFYTAVSWLPTSWNAYYHPHTESQSLAMSTDGGKTFHEYSAGNPVIDATTNTAPMYWNLTGFRDPFLEPFPELDALRGLKEPHYYAVFGSGIKGVGPRMPLWSAPARNLTDWTFLGALWEPEGNSTLGPLLSTRSYGYNFEVSNFFSLPDSEGEQHYFVSMGAEGNNLTYADYSHSALWNEGKVWRRENGSVAFEPIAGGQADWGLAYALTSFNDSKHNRRVQWGWAEEDIVGDDATFSALQQGFQGAHTLPRHLFVHEVKDVLEDGGELKKNMNSVVKKGKDGKLFAQTLGVRPLPDVVDAIRKGAVKRSFAGKAHSKSKILHQQGSQRMQLSAKIEKYNAAAGLIVGASPDMKEYTTIMYEPSNNTVLVERAHSSTIDEFNNATVVGYFYPYTIKREDGSSHKEDIKIDVFLDGSLLEIYVNDRFALTTRIYPSMECSTGYGVYVADGSKATFGSIKAWEGLMNVWPERPANSSSKLVWDTAAQSGNYTWWTGN